MNQVILSPQTHLISRLWRNSVIALFVRTIKYFSTLPKLMRVPIALTHKETGGYTAYIPSLQGCIADGATRDQALQNVKQLLLQYLHALNIDVVFEAQERGIIASIPSLPNCTSWGLTEQAALRNLQQSIARYVEAETEDHLPPNSEHASVSV